MIDHHPDVLYVHVELKGQYQDRLGGRLGPKDIDDGPDLADMLSRHLPSMACGEIVNK